LNGNKNLQKFVYLMTYLINVPVAARLQV